MAIWKQVVNIFARSPVLPQRLRHCRRWPRWRGEKLEWRWSPSCWRPARPSARWRRRHSGRRRWRPEVSGTWPVEILRHWKSYSRGHSSFKMPRCFQKTKLYDAIDRNFDIALKSFHSCIPPAFSQLHSSNRFNLKPNLTKAEKVRNHSLLERNGTRLVVFTGKLITLPRYLPCPSLATSLHEWIWISGTCTTV